MSEYDLEKIRTLLTAGFTYEELRQLCYDVPEFRPVYDELTQKMDKADFVIRLILYADRMSQLELILAWTKEHNPAAYEEYQPYYSRFPVRRSQQQQQQQQQQRQKETQIFKGIIKGIRSASDTSLVKLRLDVAVPEQVRVKWWFVLAVSVRQLSSPTLAIEDLKKVQSSDVQVYWPEDQPFVRLKVQVTAPDCLIKGDDSQFFRLYRNQDSPIVEFLLGPKRAGEINIVVAVYQEDDWLGRVRINTVVQERVVGKVNVKVRSEDVIDPLSDPPPERFRSNATRMSLISPTNFAASFSPKSRADEIKEEILVHHQRLQRLRLRIAQLGITADPSLDMETERIEKTIENLQAQLKQFQDADNSPSDSE